MNRLITSIILGFVAIAAMAQTADIEVSYVAHNPNLRDGKTDLTNQYILLSNNSESKFFSPVTQYLDSLNSTPEGKAKMKEIIKVAVGSRDFNKIPRHDGTIYVVKSFSDKQLKYYDTAGAQKLTYEEGINQWNWETVADSTKNILGYECIMATTDYHGRKWTAWFTPEIPIQNGPWKLDGLPGLILEAEAEGGQYSFIATGLQQATKTIGPVYLAEDYERTSRIDFLKSKRAFLDNPLGTIDAQFGGDVVTVNADDGEDLDNLFVPASVVDFIETDYH